MILIPFNKIFNSIFYHSDYACMPVSHPVPNISMMPNPKCKRDKFGILQPLQIAIRLKHTLLSITPNHAGST